MDIKRLKELREETEQYRAVADDRCMSTNYEDDLLELIDEALQAYQPWIPVSERLPDGDMASVLIYTKEGGVAEGQYYSTIRAWKQFRWSVEDSKVTHWKPLPEPPKGE